MNLLVNNLKNDSLSFADNCNHLFGNMFFVRTQAGLKQAVIQYAAGFEYLKDDEHTFKQTVDSLRFNEVPNFELLKFPILIEFVPVYLGYHGTDTIIQEI